MKRFPITFFFVFAVVFARADTNLPSAISLLLNEKSTFELTAGLEQYHEPARFAGKITSHGGGSAALLVNRWAAEFATIYPDVEMDYRGGGAVSGLAELLEGKLDLVPMSRPMQKEEIDRFKARFGYVPAQIIVAQDAEAIYVNTNNPLAGLTLAQLDALYSRAPKQDRNRPEFWRDLGVAGPVADERISRIALSKVHSNYAFFQEHVMGGEEYRFDVHFEAVPGSLVQAVGASDAAVGFGSLMFATARTRFVPLQAPDGSYLLPTYDNVLSGRYPLVRPMRIVFHRKPDGSMNPAAREFLRFAISRRGQRIISLAGSFPITAEQQRDASRMIERPL